MRKTMVLIGVFLIFFLSSHAEEIAKSSVKKVVLFSNEAQVTRQALVKVKRGVNKVFLESTAFNVDENSLMAKVKGRGEILGVQFTTVPLKEPSQENIKDIEERIKNLEREKKSLYSNIEVLDKKKQFLNSLIDFSNSQLSKEIVTNFPKTEDLRNMLQFLGYSYEEINTKKQSLEEKIEDLDRDIEVLRQQLASIAGNKTKIKRVIEVLFASQREQQISIEVSYIVRGAWWRPLYKINVLHKKDINLVMFARIYQKTGENWDNVELTVSNVTPLKGQKLPEPQSRYLYLRPQFRHFNKIVTEGGRGSWLKSLPVGSADKYPMAEEIKGKVASDKASFASSIRRRLSFSFEYTLPHKVTIKSKDRESIYPIFSKKIKGEIYHYVVALDIPYAFLVCKASSDSELLSGVLQIYHEGRYVGKTVLQEKKPGEDFLVNLGIDREVKIKREKIEDKKEETFFGKIERQNIIRKLTYKITVENLKDKNVKLHIFDAVPISKTDKITVRDIKITPKPQQQDYKDKKGVMFWDLRLSPKEKKEITISYTVIYPKSASVYGLD